MILEKYTVVAWGGYQYFRECIDTLKKRVNVQYVYGELRYITDSYGCKIIENEEDLLEIRNLYVIICLGKVSDVAIAAEWLKNKNIPFAHADFIMTMNAFSIRYIKAIGGIYKDFNGNIIRVSNQIKTDNIYINIGISKNAEINIGKIRVRTKLYIRIMGHDGVLNIGDGSSFIECSMLINSCGKISVGKDCMFSRRIELNQPDQHFIFDLDTKRRINYPKEIVVGNHVWVGRDVLLLGGAKIGDGSICGTHAVTSATFPENVIIAGCPAKIIRSNVIWARDQLENGDYDMLEQCKDQTGLLYIKDDDKSSNEST